jgi:hypothetical protein
MDLPSRHSPLLPAPQRLIGRGRAPDICLRTSAEPLTAPTAISSNNKLAQVPELTL